MNVATYAFDVCWFDQVASLKRFYKLLYHVRRDGHDEIRRHVGQHGRQCYRQRAGARVRYGRHG